MTAPLNLLAERENLKMLKLLEAIASIGWPEPLHPTLPPNRRVSHPWCDRLPPDPLSKLR